ncbi:MAG TPA: hypothetical protein PLX55_01875 [bacterium]|nr:hypothetical protein [bacterium]
MIDKSINSPYNLSESFLKHFACRGKKEKAHTEECVYDFWLGYNLSK